MTDDFGVLKVSLNYPTLPNFYFFLFNLLISSDKLIINDYSKIFKIRYS